MNSQLNKAKSAIESGNITQVQIDQTNAEKRPKLPNGVSRVEGNAYPPTGEVAGIVYPQSPKPSENYLDPYVDALIRSGNLDFDLSREGAKNLLFNDDGTQTDLGLKLLGTMMEKASEISRDPISRISKYKQISDDYLDQFKFDINTKRGDIFEPPPYMQSGDVGSLKNTPFVDTSNIEHNDPTILGFELYIDVIKSPLFDSNEENIMEFLNKYSGYDEINERIAVYQKFKEQFFKFFRLEHVSRNRDIFNLDISGDRSSIDPDLDTLGYYIKSISGLNTLLRNVSPGDKKKQFADFEVDKITLTFHEDVALNFTYLAYLYKTLVWSSKSGKRIIPENLLRFDMSIVIYEIRNFNRVIHALETDNLSIVQDKFSKIEYNLYDCQLNFLNFPHGDTLDLWETPKYSENATVDITYKYVDSAFYKFKMDKFNPLYDIIGVYDNTQNYEVYINDLPSKYNKKDFVVVEEVSFNSIETDEELVSGVKLFKQPVTTKRYAPGSSENEGEEDVKEGQSAAKKRLKDLKKEERKKKFKNYVKESSNNIKKMGINIANAEIRDKTIMLNNLIFKGFMKFGLLGSIAYNAVNQFTAKEDEKNITPPNNVYTQDQIVGFLRGLLQQKMGGITNFFDDLRTFNFQKKK